MSAVVHDVEQRSPEWYELRCGIVTTSELKSVRAKGEGKVRKSYMLRLAGEIITGVPAETYSNDHMARGREQEAEARNLYSFVRDADPQLVGFLRDDDLRAGCSPDALLSSDGALEIKCVLPHVSIEALLRTDAPPEYKAQCQGILWIAEREWIDLCIYSPALPLCVNRCYRDEGYIQELREEVARFNEELDQIVERVRRYGAAA